MATQKEIQYLRIALAMTGIAVHDSACEVILEVQKAQKRMGGKYDLETSCKIETSIRAKYEKLAKEEKKK